MSVVPHLLRFFIVVSPVPRSMLWTFAVVSVAACVKVAINPGTTREALMPILLMQAFAASTGFTSPARRGYYDPLLTRDGSRIGMALVQWLASVAPGIAACMLIAIVEWVLGAAPVMATSGTIVALALISVLAWTISVPLPRFGGAIGWLLVIVLANGVAFQSDDWWTASLASDGVVLSALRVVVLPAVLVGQDVSTAPVVAASSLALVVSAMAGALLWIDRMDIPLEASQ